MSLNRIISTGIFSELRFEFRNHVIYSRFFFKLNEIGNNATIGITGITM